MVLKYCINLYKCLQPLFGKVTLHSFVNSLFNIRLENNMNTCCFYVECCPSKWGPHFKESSSRNKFFKSRPLFRREGVGGGGKKVVELLRKKKKKDVCIYFLFLIFFGR